MFSFSKLFSPAVFLDHGHEEIELVADHFRSIEVGFFIEVGAFDPILYSQSQHLEIKGWRGICVEPVPAYADEIRKIRKAKVVQAACVSRNYNSPTVELIVDGPFTSSADTGRGAKERTLAKATTLDAIISENDVKHIDFLSVDVEGLEVEVLKGLSFERYRPSLILLEDHCLDNSRHRFMREVGYKRVRRTGLNSWYVDEKSDFPVSPWGRFQLYRKYHLSTPIRKLRRYLGRR